MEPYVAFSNDAFLQDAAPWERSLEGQIWETIPGKTQPAPIEESTEEAAPTEEPTEEAPPTEEPTEEVAPTEEPTEEPTAPKATISEPTGEPDIPPVWHEDKERERFPIVISLAGWRYCIQPGQ